MSRLNEGTEVMGIIFPDESSFRVSDCDGPLEVESIKVVLEYGQMAMVPWFEVTLRNGTQTMHNSAHVSSVVLGGE